MTPTSITTAFVAQHFADTHFLTFCFCTILSASISFSSLQSIPLSLWLSQTHTHTRARRDPYVWVDLVVLSRTVNRVMHQVLVSPRRRRYWVRSPAPAARRCSEGLSRPPLNEQVSPVRTENRTAIRTPGLLSPHTRTRKTHTHTHTLLQPTRQPPPLWAG